MPPYQWTFAVCEGFNLNQFQANLEFIVQHDPYSIIIGFWSSGLQNTHTANGNNRQWLVLILFCHQFCLYSIGYLWPLNFRGIGIKTDVRQIVYSIWMYECIFIIEIIKYFFFHHKRRVAVWFQEQNCSVRLCVSVHLWLILFRVEKSPSKKNRTGTISTTNAKLKKKRKLK